MPLMPTCRLLVEQTQANRNPVGDGRRSVIFAMHVVAGQNTTHMTQLIQFA